MYRRVGTYIRAQRRAKGIKVSKLVAQLGYKNLGKGANKINRLEVDGESHPEFLKKVVEALDLDSKVIQQLLDEDYREFLEAWKKWADQPIRPHLILKVLPGVYIRRQIPDDALEPEAAQAYTRQFILENKSWQWTVWLVLSRRLTVAFDLDGNVTGHRHATPGIPNHPYMTLGRSKSPVMF